MDMFEYALELLPAELRAACGKFRNQAVEEIRLRLYRIPTVLISQREIGIWDKFLDRATLELVLERACGASVHAHMDEMSTGYLNYKGLRIGFGARAVIKDGRIISFKDFSSLNIRIPAVFQGEIDAMLEYFRINDSGNILLISPPGGGKTSLLRELIRRFSDEGVRISVADERNEIAAAYQGKMHFDLGKHTDVLCAVDKKTSAMLLLRGMNPQMIALDEISREEDMEAVFDIAGCGVRLLATVHGRNIQGLKKRELYRRMLNEQIFTDAIVIENKPQGRNYVHKRLV